MLPRESQQPTEAGSGLHPAASLAPFSREAVASLLDDLPALSCAMTRDGEVLFFNDTWLRYTGQGHDEALKQGWLSALHVEDARTVEVGLRAARDAGEEYEHSLRLRRHDGAYRWFLLQARPLRAGAALLDGYVASATDISAYKQQEATMQEAAERMLRSNAELERFAYAAAHDIAEPLRMIASYAQLLCQKLEPQLDDDTRRYREFLVGGVTRLRSLVRDLLEISRLTSPAHEHRSPVETASAVREALSNLELLLRESGVRVAVSELPDVQAHRGQLVHLLQNLLSNAVKFRSELEPSIEIGGVREGSFVRLWVRDNGVGMPSENTERAFVLFQRLHSRKRFPGSGIGLALCKQVVDMHGGRIWIDSAPQQGTTVSFTLPSALEPAT